MVQSTPLPLKLAFSRTGYGKTQKKTTSRDSRMDGYIWRYDVAPSLFFHYALCNEHDHPH